MLTKLYIKNFALIREITFRPGKELNILTGETGSGKSVILDALGLIMGERADLKLMAHLEGKSIIEGEFLLRDNHLKPVFEENDLDYDKTLLIRREFLQGGKSRSFVNDTPVSLQVLKDISSPLIAIHSQHENLQLNEKDFQFDFIDYFSGANSIRSQYQQNYIRYTQLQSDLKQAIDVRNELIREKDFLEFLLNELDEMSLSKNEESELESELNLLTHAENIVNVSSEWVETMDESENSIISVITALRNKFKGIEDASSSAKEISKRIQSVIVELKDLVAESESLRDSIQSDEARMEEINERLNKIQTLKRKHNVQDLQELLLVQEEISNKLFNIGDSSDRVEQLELELEQVRLKLIQEGTELHNLRSKALPTLSKKIKELLTGLEMNAAEIQFELSIQDEPGIWGMDELKLLFSANKGMPVQELTKVASGGELSRLALCMRTIEAAGKGMGTLIFDEIDTGVSGRVADTIGKMLSEISNSHQIIAITHLPQVAGYGDNHFKVMKFEENAKTVSILKELNREERLNELADMLSGNTATEIALKNAGELLKN